MRIGHAAIACKTQSHKAVVLNTILAPKEAIAAVTNSAEIKSAPSFPLEQNQL